MRHLALLSLLGLFDCVERLPEGNHYPVCGSICGPHACQPQPLPFEP